MYLKRAVVVHVLTFEGLRRILLHLRVWGLLAEPIDKLCEVPPVVRLIICVVVPVGGHVGMGPRRPRRSRAGKRRHGRRIRVRHARVAVTVRRGRGGRGGEGHRPAGSASLQGNQPPLAALPRLLAVQNLLQVVYVADCWLQCLYFTHLFVLGGTGDVLAECGEGWVDMLHTVPLPFVPPGYSCGVRLVAKLLGKINSSFTPQDLSLVPAELLSG